MTPDKYSDGCFNGKPWCAGQDLNLHALRRQPLKLVCLPIPPPARKVHLAGGQGFEPWLPGPEPGVLPVTPSPNESLMLFWFQP